MPLYGLNSTRFGSIMINRTSDGVARIKIDIIIAFMLTDLPEPVVPPMSKWGIFARSDTIQLPSTSRPMATCKGPASAYCKISPKSTV